jgi:hypothetical protein
MAPFLSLAQLSLLYSRLSYINREINDHSLKQVAEARVNLWSFSAWFFPEP